ncbi:MAG: alpha-glucosidase C-terminal domain-containing protein [Balneolales bacterium]|nr:alpha-glucosidase C-terminal domain-containing protein [Balneolales bacterium]
MKFYLAYFLLVVVMFVGCNTPQPQTFQIEVNHPEWIKNQTIYEVNIRQFSEEGSFAAVQRELPRIKELGIGILWLMPIHPIGEVNRKGTLGSYYSVQDYFDVNPEFGTKDDFRNLVNAAQELDMYVVLDWGANHTAWDNELTTTNPEFFETNDEVSFIPPRGTDWDDVIQLDYDNPEVWDYMISALSYWFREFNIDGYRTDVAYLVPLELWNRARTELDAIKPVFMLAESDLPEHHIAAFDMTYNWKLHHLFGGIARGEEPVSRIDEIIAEDKQLFPENAIRMQFTSNHDENSWQGTVFERMGDAAKTFAVLASTIDGMPLLYNGQEIGLNKRLEFFEKDAIEWTESAFTEFYTRLFNLNRTNEALFNGSYGGQAVRLESDNDDALYAFVREKNESKVLVVLNLSDSEIIASVKNELLEGTYTELFTDATVTLTEQNEFSLKPWEYLVYYY